MQYTYSTDFQLHTEMKRTIIHVRTKGAVSLSFQEKAFQICSQINRQYVVHQQTEETAIMVDLILYVPSYIQTTKPKQIYTFRIQKQTATYGIGTTQATVEASFKNARTHYVNNKCSPKNLVIFGNDSLNTIFQVLVGIFI